MGTKYLAFETAGHMYVERMPELKACMARALILRIDAGTTYW